MMMRMQKKQDEKSSVLSQVGIGLLSYSNKIVPSPTPGRSIERTDGYNNTILLTPDRSPTTLTPASEKPVRGKKEFHQYKYRTTYMRCE